MHPRMCVCVEISPAFRTIISHLYDRGESSHKLLNNNERADGNGKDMKKDEEEHGNHYNKHVIPAEHMAIIRRYNSIELELYEYAKVSMHVNAPAPL